MSSPSSYDYVFRPSLNLTAFTWLTVSFSSPNASLLLELARVHQLQVGLVSHPNDTYAVDWFSLGRGQYSITSASGHQFEVQLFLPGGGTGPSKTQVNSIELQVLGNGTYPRLTLAPPTIVGVENSTIDPAWFAEMGSYHARYLLFDASMYGGLAESDEYASAIVAALTASGLAVPVMVTPGLQLYELE
jgi:hypothetical protein